MKITGTYINYYFHCHRQLWLFANNIKMEDESDAVRMGKYLSENSYKREEHEIYVSADGDEAVFDFYDAKNKIIHEVKKSKKMEETHIWQVKFYLSILERKGIEGAKAIIDYPLMKRKSEVILDNTDRKKLMEIKIEIRNILERETPPAVINKPFCKQCSYYELCYV